MSYRLLGIDVGSVSAGLCVVDENRSILQSEYLFHNGEIEKSIATLMQGLDLEAIDRVVATDSTPSRIDYQKKYNSELSYITAARYLHADARALLVVGGEKFSLSRFADDGQYLGSRTNTSCAAGTGSFLDQQAARLKLGGIEELSRVAARAGSDFPKIASRCAVFAKTDLIHAQQEGYSLEEISGGLCYGLARNIVDTLFSGDLKVKGRLLFCGGVAKNRSVVGHISSLTGLDIEVPELGHVYGALGACLMDLDEGGGLEDETSRGTISKILTVRKKGANAYYYPPLTLRHSEYPDFTCHEQYQDNSANPVEVDIYRPLERGDVLDVWLGVDIGSTSTKAVLIDRDSEVLVGFYTRTAGSPLKAVQAIFKQIDAIQEREDIQFHVVRCGTTGSGRKFIGKIVGADGVIDEITAHARAACQLNPEVDTIIEIGGQDAKFTTLSDGRVSSSTMNTVCAAGTGSFIEEQATKLGCSITDYAERTAGVCAPMVSDRCTVFMERDMNHYRSEGYSVDEVLAAALHAVRENYLLKVATEKHIGSTVLFQGATAKNRSLVAAFEQRLNCPILVSRFCHLTGALGTALIVKEEQGESSFVGFQLYKEQIPLTGEVCDICTNHCKISVAEVGGNKVAYGFLCGRDYDTKSYVKVTTGAFDLFRERKKVERFTLESSGSGPVIGIPAAVHLMEDLPMWRHFFNTLGLQTYTSESYGDAMKNGKNLTAAEFCAPVTALHGHVTHLLGKADYVFLPTYLEEKAKNVRRQYCYYTQFLPALASGLSGGAEQQLLRPVIRYLYTSFHTKMQLYRMLNKIGMNKWSFLDVSQAFDKAVFFRKQSRELLQQVMEERTTQSKDISVVYLGRPYTVLSTAMNGTIPDIFNRQGVDGYYQDMVRYEEGEIAPVQPLLDELHWQHAVKILEVAEVVAKRQGLYPVFLTSFKCSPDAFALEYFKAVMDRHHKPYLVLQLDEHDSSVGYETRIEAAIRSFRNHYEKKRAFLPVDYAPVNPDIAKNMNRPHVAFPNYDRITCSLLAGALRREGYNAHLLKETEGTIRESLKHNSGECIPLNAIAQDYISWMASNDMDPGECVLWLNKSSLACNIRLYPHHIKQILASSGYKDAGIYVGQLSFSEISIRAATNAYFAFMLGGMLRRVACKIRPYELNGGETDRVLDKSVRMLTDAFAGKRDREKVLREILSRLEWIDTEYVPRPKVAIFGDMYVRDNRVMNQDLVRYIEESGGEVITTPYSEYAKMIAPSYFRKWFNEGKYYDYLANKALLATMSQLEKGYLKMFAGLLGEPEYEYDDDPTEILAHYGIVPENTGESMDNILKIHYIKKHHPDVSLFVQASPALCCPSLITEAMGERIEKTTGVPVVSITYDGTGGDKNSAILPYLKYPRRKELTAGDKSRLLSNTW
ncbi:acyl-CoA dehydratase activase [Desulfopila sp. IMCC35008]|uniref:acyl-CoA dehydratase activase n=1 Tax=Desulfopila sp. IMCC35008 TaxID=2653858 RepID=UPI0013D2BB44|nr:acyl-CoA dehydratase activase [Desulfopila sp. IMCC35008]